MKNCHIKCRDRDGFLPCLKIEYKIHVCWIRCPALPVKCLLFSLFLPCLKWHVKLLLDRIWRPGLLERFVQIIMSHVSSSVSSCPAWKLQVKLRCVTLCKECVMRNCPALPDIKCDCTSVMSYPRLKVKVTKPMNDGESRSNKSQPDSS